MIIFLGVVISLLVLLLIHQVSQVRRDSREFYQSLWKYQEEIARELYRLSLQEIPKIEKSTSLIYRHLVEKAAEVKE